MDMSNATAAGPPRGLLDVIFGSKPEEGAEADGQGFMPLMDLIKALNKKGSEDEASNRTDKEIAPGKGAIEDGTAGMPGWLPTLMMMPPPVVVTPQAVPEKVIKDTAEMPKLASPAVGLDPALVNRMLREKSLPALTPEETKLLGEVNGKIEKLASEIASEGDKAAAAVIAKLDKSVAGAGEPRAAKESANEAAFVKELSQKGIDPKMLKGPEGAEANAAPEKFLSTEAYMQMHDRFGKQAKGAEVEVQKKTGIEEIGSVTPSKDALLPIQVSATSEKGKDLLGKSKNLPELSKADGKEKVNVGDSLFDAGLMQTLKSSGGVETREITLPGTKPAEMREALLGEVGQSVSLQALKGGGEMRLVIYPEALGEVKLKISTRSDGKVDVQVTAQNEDVAKTIRGGAKDLESSLRDQSLSLAKFDVTVSDSPVAASDTRNSFSDQFNSPQQNLANQHGFQREERGQFGQWDANQQQRQAFADAGLMDAPRGAARVAASSMKAGSSRGSSGRLDVVA